ncbi:MAG: hypothetical protein AVDCRST_MAG43-235, partial [uncultured Thermomicrobiales bacterium]
ERDRRAAEACDRNRWVDPVANVRYRGRHPRHRTRCGAL